MRSMRPGPRCASTQRLTFTSVICAPQVQRTLAVAPRFCERGAGAGGGASASVCSSEHRTVVLSSWFQLPVAASMISGTNPPSTSRMIHPAPMEWLMV